MTVDHVLSLIAKTLSTVIALQDHLISEACRLSGAICDEIFDKSNALPTRFGNISHELFTSFLCGILQISLQIMKEIV